jgi:hypothetical protein
VMVPEVVVAGSPLFFVSSLTSPNPYTCLFIDLLARAPCS